LIFFSIIAPCLPVAVDESPSPSLGQIIVTIVNTISRMILTILFMARFPRPEINFMTFPVLNVFASLTFSIRVYELLEMGDNKEYDGYRFYRSWMWSSLLNIPFCIIGLVLVLLGSPGLIAISILVLVWNILNVGRCFLAQWACKESGNDIHPDFETVIKQYHL